MDVELIIAGQIDDYDYYQKMLNISIELGLQNKLKIIGPISESDKIWYYQNCKAFLFPSIAEGFGLPVIEAMHFGKPVFLSDRTALPEIGGDAAFYFKDFSSASIQQSFSEGMRIFEENKLDYIKKLKARALGFNWQNQVKEYVDLYDLMLQA